MWRGRRLWLRSFGLAGLEDGAVAGVVHDQQRDVVLAAVGALELAQRVIADRAGRQPHLDQRLAAAPRARRRSSATRSSISPSV